MSFDAEETVPRMLRIKWTSQRCHDAPASTRGIEVQPGVRIGDDQAHAAQAPLLEATQERSPEHFVLAVADVDAQDLPIPVGGHTGRNDDGSGMIRWLIRALM